MSSTITIEDIRAAAAVIDGKVLRTPCLPSSVLSELSGATVVLKLENLQHTCSFKVRGAVNKLSALDPASRKAGVIAASAGNHAQGIAYFARRLGIPATIVMPQGTPFSKVTRTEALGAKVVHHGNDLAVANDHAVELAAGLGGQYVHPYDDPLIIAGQGTIGLEMLEDHPDLDALIVPIGGGGLISGIATAAKAVKPDIQVFGVQAALYPSMYTSLKGGKQGCEGQTVAEGIAVTQPGDITRPIVKKLVTEIFLADERALERAMQTFLMKQRLVVEGAGAAPLSALMENRGRFEGKKVGLLVSGGNVDSSILSSILMRGLVRDSRLVSLRVGITDAPGLLAKVSGLIGECGGNIVQVHHQRLFQDVPVKLAEVDLVVETRGAEHVRQLMDSLDKAGFHVRLLSSSSEED